jgi:hypothetical protein
MNKKTLIIVALIVMVVGVLPLGTLYAAGLMEYGNQGKAQVPEGTEVYDVYQLTLDNLIYLPLIEYNLPLVSTPTPTPTSLPNEVVINHIEPGKLNDEYVRVKNRTTQTVDITGWTIKAKESGRTYTFPKFYLDPNDAVTVWTKGGINEGMDLYWGLSTEVWDDKDDCGRLGDEFDELLFWFCYSSSTPVAPTPTSQPIPDVIINKIEPGSYIEEYVRVKNRTLSTVNLKGWRIKSKESGLIYTFPDFKLKPDAAVFVWSQTGTTTETDLYWHSTTQVWNDKSDCARLSNNDDELVDYFCYP